MTKQLPLPAAKFSGGHENPDFTLTFHQSLLSGLLKESLVLREEWEKLPPKVQEELRHLPKSETLYDRLREQGLLNEYQADRLKAGKKFGLVLGNYRVLNRLGAGGMGIVFKAEHIRLRREVAIKVLPIFSGPDDLHHEREVPYLSRFYAEVRGAARLQHSNIVSAIDIGIQVSPDPDEPTLHYFVMEYVPGKDLETIVTQQGPLPLDAACDVIYQIASALAAADAQQLVHRDIKPANIMVTPEGQAKLLDFGLVHDVHNRLTHSGAVMGTPDYMAPEQARDASQVDIRADLYALGGVWFWSLTGRLPFLETGNLAQVLARRLTHSPPSVCAIRPDMPIEVDTLLARLMAPEARDRYPNPKVFMKALEPLLKTRSQELFLPTPAVKTQPGSSQATPGVTESKILIADDDPTLRTYCRLILEGEGILCDEVANGQEVLEAVQEEGKYDLVLLDVDMPQMDGMEALRRLRADDPGHRLKVLMFSGGIDADEMAQTMLAGADDFLTKPFSAIQLKVRARNALLLKASQDRHEQVRKQLLALNADLERSLTARGCDLVETRNALVLALARVVQCRGLETNQHLHRMGRYCSVLAKEASRIPVLAETLVPTYMDLFVCCVPLHDLGNVTLPDHILLKPGKLEPDERLLMQTHTLAGSETLRTVAQECSSSVVFLQMGIDICRSHHERFDGQGYPDRLAGDAIPLAARMVALADVYDALRSRRPHKPALSHPVAVQLLREGSPGQFDPSLLKIFEQYASQFEEIYRSEPD